MKGDITGNIKDADTQKEMLKVLLNGYKGLVLIAYKHKEPEGQLAFLIDEAVTKEDMEGFIDGLQTAMKEQTGH